jgi:polyisoprenoid-binding protein YceI
MVTNIAGRKTVPIPDGRWRVKPDSGGIAFRTRLLGVVSVSGGFRVFSGELEVDAAKVTAGELLIEVGSLETGNARRDKHLCSEDFFEVEKFPSARFSLAEVSSHADGATISGTLQIRDRALAIHTPATVVPGAGDSVRIEATPELDPREIGFAFKFLPKVVRMEIDLTLERCG